VFEERNGVAGDALAATGETQAVGCGGFDAYLRYIQMEVLR
jgi:hypothetical protein